MPEIKASKQNSSPRHAMDGKMYLTTPGVPTQTNLLLGLRGQQEISAEGPSPSCGGSVTGGAVKEVGVEVELLEELVQLLAPPENVTEGGS